METQQQSPVEAKWRHNNNHLWRSSGDTTTITSGGQVETTTITSGGQVETQQQSPLDKVASGKRRSMAPTGRIYDQLTAGMKACYVLKRVFFLYRGTINKSQNRRMFI